MKKFTEKDALACGWRVVHRQPERAVHLGPGATQLIAGVYRAEKTYETRDGHHALLDEQAESLDQLLAKIEAWEANQNRLHVAPAEQTNAGFSDFSDNQPKPTPDETLQGLGGSADPAQSSSPALAPPVFHWPTSSSSIRSGGSGGTGSGSSGDACGRRPCNVIVK